MIQGNTTLGRWFACTLVVSVFAIGALVTMLIASNADKESTQAKYPLIAKRLFAEDPNDIVVNFTDLRQSLREYAAKSPEKIGVYFEYLPTGVNINVGANDEFFRASLVKLPLIMRTYKLIEAKVLTLDDLLTVEENQLDSDFGDLYKKGAGTKISVRELITLVLTKSDNTAFNVLYERVNVRLLQDQPDGDRSIDDVYDYLDIPRDAEGTTPMITPKNFSSILKSLYFSAYLSYAHSNEILDTMTQPHSEEWARREVPESMKVADKIGVYNIEPEELQVHADCGIYYYPKRQYLLCIMVHSGETNTSVSHLQKISKMVYTFVDQRKAN